VNVTWVAVPGTSRLQLTPVGLELVDDFTGQAPSGRLDVRLEARPPGASTWTRVDHPPTLTPGGWIAFIGLGRTSNPTGKPVVRHRVSLTAEAMLPLYGPSPLAGHVEFDVHPFDDAHPPGVGVDRQKVFLLPAPGYAFPGEVPVARGRVIDAAGAPVARALVTFSTKERVLSDARGQFALPLRWAAKNTTVQIDAADGAGGLGSVAVNIPGGLRRALEIQLS
jgi:hypothetical protein